MDDAVNRIVSMNAEADPRHIINRILPPHRPDVRQLTGVVDRSHEYVNKLTSAEPKWRSHVSCLDRSANAAPGAGW